MVNKVVMCSLFQGYSETNIMLNGDRLWNELKQLILILTLAHCRQEVNNGHLENRHAW